MDWIKIKLKSNNSHNESFFWFYFISMLILQLKKPAAHIRGNALGLEHIGKKKKKGRKSPSAVASLSDKVQSKDKLEAQAMEQCPEASTPWFTILSFCFLPGGWFLHFALRPGKHQHLDRYQRHQIHQGMPPEQRSDLTSPNSSERTSRKFQTRVSACLTFLQLLSDRKVCVSQC